MKTRFLLLIGLWGCSPLALMSQQGFLYKNSTLGYQVLWPYLPEKGDQPISRESSSLEIFENTLSRKTADGYDLSFSVRTSRFKDPSLGLASGEKAENMLDGFVENLRRKEGAEMVYLDKFSGENEVGRFFQMKRKGKEKILTGKVLLNGDRMFVILAFAPEIPSHLEVTQGFVHSFSAMEPSEGAITLTLMEDNFSLTFPGIPMKQPLALEDQRERDLCYVLPQPEKGGVYMLIRMEHPRFVRPFSDWHPDSLHSLLRAGPELVIESFQGKIMKENPIEYEGYPGLDMVIKTGEGKTLKGRSVLTRGDNFIFLVEATSGIGDDQKAKAFMESLNLKNNP